MKTKKRGGQGRIEISDWVELSVIGIEMEYILIFHEDIAKCGSK